MNKYRPIHRCRLCGATITSDFTQMEPSTAVRTAAWALDSAPCATNPYSGIKARSLHTCDDGSVGVADFCGMEREK